MTDVDRVAGHPRRLGGASVSPLCLAAVAAAGVGLAAWLPDSAGPGLFLPMIALLGGTAVILARDAGLGFEGWVLGALGMGLVSMTAVRAAEWLVAPNLLFALVCAALALTSPSTWRGALEALLAPSSRLLGVSGMVVRSTLEALGTTSPVKAVALARGLAAGAVLVGVFGALFASADGAFFEVVVRLLPDWDLGLFPVRVVLFACGATITAAFVLARVSGPAGWLRSLVRRADQRFGWTLGPAEWILALVLLDLLFACFMSIQMTVLFGGHDHILQTTGLTYAEYARRGFFQLLVATALVVPVMVTAWTRSTRQGHANRVLLKVLLGILGLLSLGIVASALRRLGLYEQAFGFTNARLAAHAVALWLGALLLIMMVAGLFNRSAWLFRSTLALTAAALLAFNAINPEETIARKNWERYLQTGSIDIAYLAGLSADAVPYLVGLPDKVKEPALHRQREKLAKVEPWSSANLSRERARSALQAQEASEGALGVSLQGRAGLTGGSSYLSDRTIRARINPLQ